MNEAFVLPTISRRQRYGHGALQKAQQIALRRQPDLGSVYMAHGVVAKEQDIRDPWLDITRGTLRHKLEEALTRGCTFRTIGAVTAEDPSARYMTFDDGLDNFLPHALPVLRELAIPYCLFITTGVLGREGFLTVDAVADLARDPLCTIGAHSVSHPMFRYISEQSMRTELVDSKKSLESVIGRPVDIFAFPYGSRLACSRRSQRLAAEVFSRTFSTIQAQLTPKAVRTGLFLPRWNLCESTSRAGLP